MQLCEFMYWILKKSGQKYFLRLASKISFLFNFVLVPNCLNSSCITFEVADKAMLILCFHAKSGPLGSASYPSWCWALADSLDLSTGMHFRRTATSKLTAPIKTLANHNSQLSGTVSANVPKNSIIMTWKVTVETMTIINVQLSKMPLKTFIFSISRLFISLNT